ncbi:MAG: HIT family protein [Christensenellales bacterium]
MDCVFCKIIKGEIPCYKVYEDEQTLAFLDIAHDVDGHTLVIPKNHCRNVLDCNENDLLSVMKSVQKISQHYIKNCGFEGVNIINANEGVSGQSVFHLHFHIFPRKANDKVVVLGDNKLATQSFEDILRKLKLN